MLSAFSLMPSTEKLVLNGCFEKQEISDFCSLLVYFKGVTCKINRQTSKLHSLDSAYGPDPRLHVSD